jgi:hypothetical protein
VIEGWPDPFVTHGIGTFLDPSHPDDLYIHAVNHIPSASC